MGKFNVLILPEQGEKYAVHAQCFLEVADLLLFSLQDLGHETAFCERPEKDQTNILLGYHQLLGQTLPAEYNFVIYQLEELRDEIAKIGPLLTTLRSPCKVWDFSELNLAYLRKRGIEAQLKPLGFHPKMERIDQRKSSGKDIDILFYGCINDRRLEILEELEKHFSVKTLFGVYGSERDYWIARSKIVLSIYYYETKYFDDVRISYLLNNRAFVIVESGRNNRYEDFIVYADRENLVETCRYYLENDDAREEKAEQAYLGFQKFPETMFLQNLLENSRVGV